MANDSARISAFSGPTYHSASAVLSLTTLPSHRLAAALDSATSAPLYFAGARVPVQSNLSMSESQVGSPALPDFLVSPSPVGRRRLLFGSLVIATIVAVVGLLAAALAVDGLDGLDFVLLGLFLVTLPWTVIGFWNAAIGFLILRFARDPVAAVTPAAARIRGDEPITASTALIVCIRNEDPVRVIRNLTPVLDGLASIGSHFHLYLLSDTSDHKTAAAEEAEFGALASQWRDRIAVTYRRRNDNTGFKAGNIR